MPLTPITPRAPSREGTSTTLSRESNHKLTVPWNSLGWPVLTLFCLTNVSNHPIIKSIIWKFIWITIGISKMLAQDARSVNSIV